MPRRSAARVRASQARRRDPDRYQIPGASVALRGAIARLEIERFWPGAVSKAYRDWQQIVHHRPVRRGSHRGAYVRVSFASCDCCTLDDWRIEEREILDVAMRRLPGGASRELRRLVHRLDAQLFARGRRDPTVVAEGPWWP